MLIGVCLHVPGDRGVARNDGILAGADEPSFGHVSRAVHHPRPTGVLPRDAVGARCERKYHTRVNSQGGEQYTRHPGTHLEVAGGAF